MKKFLIAVFLMTLFGSITFAADQDDPYTTVNTNEPSHELLGLVDKTTGYGVEDARRVFPMMENGAIFSITNRDVNMVLVYKGTNTDSDGNIFDYYVHEPYTNSNARLFTNNYVFFYKNAGGTNVLRMTDGSTNHYDVSFGRGPLPTNGVPVITYSEVSGMVGDNHFARISGVSHYRGTLSINSIDFDNYGGFTFNVEPVVSVLLKGQYNELLMVSAEAYNDRLEYFIINSSGQKYDGEADVYWSATGTIDEVSNAIDEDDE